MSVLALFALILIKAAAVIANLKRGRPPWTVLPTAALVALARDSGAANRSRSALAGQVAGPSHCIGVSTAPSDANAAANAAARAGPEDGIT